MDKYLAGQHWFVSLDGKRHGPFTFATLTKAAANGVITAETEIWRRGWKKWHPARQVPGLLNEAPLAPESAADDSEWISLRQRLGHNTPGQQPPRKSRLSPENQADNAFADEWGMLAVRQTQARGNVAPSRPGRENLRKTTFDDDGDDVADYGAADRAQVAEDEPVRWPLRRFLKLAAIGLTAVVLLWGVGGNLFASRPATQTRSLKSAAATPMSKVVASADGLPTAVANLPAVIALQRNDPAAFERFKKRYADSAVNPQDDEVLSIARAALRKSVKHLLAISSGDVLLEITEASLAYMQGLQVSNPESCVALSDESKGAKLTSNLAKELPVPFVRDMSVLERIAGTNPHIAVAPLTAEEARPYLEAVFNALRRQPVKSELLGRDKLAASEFQPYCALVIAFYQAVLELPRDDKVNLLRYLYATAAINADSDLAR